MKKLLALLAGLAIIAVAQPADASHSLDNVAAQVNGGVELDVDGDGDPNASTDPDEVCTISTGETGDAALFTDVVISGLFVAGDTGLAGHLGEVEVDTVNVCVVDDAKTPAVDPIPGIPYLAHGELEPAGFRTNAGSTGINPLNGSEVCLTGTLLGGEFESTGAAFSRAIIQATYTVHECGNVTNEFASSAASVDLEADVAVVPAGEVTQGQLPSLVSAQIHSVHHGLL